ncbi:MAG: hypothetical protein HPY63_04435 [Methanobacteriaceae archaeon]|nr:hypothetical protein [Methanobacteriaceae archaeon]
MIYAFMGAYCYYHQQTEWAKELGLIVMEVERFMDLPFGPLLAAVFPGEMYIVCCSSIIYYYLGSIEPLRGVLENLTCNWRMVYRFDGWEIVKERIEHAKLIFLGAVTILGGLESGGWFSRLSSLGGGLDLLVNGLREYEQWYKSEGYKYDDALRLKA